jgi:hypothetical protein
MTVSLPAIRSESFSHPSDAASKAAMAAVASAAAPFVVAAREWTKAMGTVAAMTTGATTLVAVAMAVGMRFTPAGMFPIRRV